MKNFLYAFPVFILLAVLVMPLRAQPQTKPQLSVGLNTADTTITINDSVFKAYEIERIEKMLGKPDRIRTDSFRSSYERFGTAHSKPYSTPITVVNYYYIYDRIGIMLFTANGIHRSKTPDRLCICFNNKRSFTNTKPQPFSPNKAFSGLLKINGQTLAPDKKLIPDTVNYRTAKFTLFGTEFGPSSYTGDIDGLYSLNSELYMLIFLDNEKDQRISYMIVN